MKHLKILMSALITISIPLRSETVSIGPDEVGYISETTYSDTGLTYDSVSFTDHCEIIFNLGSYQAGSLVFLEYSTSTIGLLIGPNGVPETVYSEGTLSGNTYYRYKAYSNGDCEIRVYDDGSCNRDRTETYQVTNQGRVSGPPVRITDDRFHWKTPKWPLISSIVSDTVEIEGRLKVNDPRSVQSVVGGFTVEYLDVYDSVNDDPSQVFFSVDQPKTEWVWSSSGLLKKQLYLTDDGKLHILDPENIGASGVVLDGVDGSIAADSITVNGAVIDGAEDLFTEANIEAVFASGVEASTLQLNSADVNGATMSVSHLSGTSTISQMQGSISQAQAVVQNDGILFESTDSQNGYAGITTELRNGVLSVSSNFSNIEFLSDLSSNTNEPVITVRRDSDGADRTFSGAELQTTALLDWVTELDPSANGLVMRLHNQGPEYLPAGNSAGVVGFSTSNTGDTRWDRNGWYLQRGKLFWRSEGLSSLNRIEFMSAARFASTLNENSRSVPQDLVDSWVMWYSAEYEIFIYAPAVSDYPWDCPPHTWKETDDNPHSRFLEPLYPTFSGFIGSAPLRDDESVTRFNGVYTETADRYWHNGESGEGSAYFQWTGSKWRHRVDNDPWETTAESYEDVEYPWLVQNWTPVEGSVPSFSDFEGGDPRAVGLDLVQTDEAKMPRIVEAGQLVLEEGVTALKLQNYELVFESTPTKNIQLLPVATIPTLNGRTLTATGNVTMLASEVSSEWGLTAGSSATVDVYPDRIVITNPAEISEDNQLTTKAYVDAAGGDAKAHTDSALNAVAADIAKGVTAHGWGDHSQTGYLKPDTTGDVQVNGDLGVSGAFTLDAPQGDISMGVFVAD